MPSRGFFAEGRPGRRRLPRRPDPVGFAPPLPQLLIQPGPQGRHALLRPGDGLRLDLLGLFKTNILIDPGLDRAVVHLAGPLEAIPECAQGAGVDLRPLEKIQGQKRKGVFHVTAPLQIRLPPSPGGRP